MAKKHYDSSYSIALDILNKIQSGGQKINNQNKEVTITENGTQTFKADKGYTGIGEMKVKVETPVQKIGMLERTINSNGFYIIDTFQTGLDGFNRLDLTVDIPMQSLYVTENGEYVAPEGGYNVVNVNVPSGSSCKVGVCFDGAHYTDDDSFVNELRDNLKYTEQLYNKWDHDISTGMVVATSYFSNDKKMVYAPNIATENIKDMSSMFSGCSNLVYVPILNTKSVSGVFPFEEKCGLNNMFYQCTSLKSVNLPDTSTALSTASMFDGCTSLESVNLPKTDRVENMNQMFMNCTSLESVNLPTTSSVTSLRSIFSYCKKLKSFSIPHTEKVVIADSMFDECKSLKNIPDMNFPVCESFIRFASGCNTLNEVGTIKSPMAKDMRWLFEGCWELYKVEEIDMSSVNQAGYEFSGCNELRYCKIIGFGGFENWLFYDFSNMQNWGDETPIPSHPEISLTQARQSVIETLVTKSCDRKANGWGDLTVTLSSYTLNLLTDTEKGIATGKGYVLQA